MARTAERWRSLSAHLVIKVGKVYYVIHSTVVLGVLIVGAEATVRDYFPCADQSNPLYLQITPTVKTPGTEYAMEVARQ